MSFSKIQGRPILIIFIVFFYYSELYLIRCLIEISLVVTIINFFLLDVGISETVM